jgi:histidyl-tRNA synthetase
MKPSLPKGTRDFSPLEMMRRNYIFDVIKGVYQRHGFQQIETPSMENSETLMGKYGEEGDKLIFNILDSGNFVADHILHLPEEEYKKKVYPDGRLYLQDLVRADILKDYISSKALRYDLTVPFARYVVMHQNEITFPFKRFQIQPVWRADRPQKGRYREFYQCDADIIGSNSLLNEVELIQIIDDVFSQLEIDVVIKLNNRKILFGIAEAIGASGKETELAIAIDKLEKIDFEGVVGELKLKGFNETQINKINEVVLKVHAGRILFKDKIEFLKNDIELQKSELFNKGIEEIEEVFSHFTNIKSEKLNLELDITLARGLNYYTGSIIEVKAKDVSIGSICGGGRYDDLTGIFGLPNVSGVGISFGADRIYDVLEEKNLFPDFSNVSTKILFVNFGNEEAKYCLKLLQRLRNDGINAELYPDAAKMKKQMSYADAKKIPFVALIGSEEMKTGEITIKNMSTAEQSKVTVDELLHLLK